MWFCPKQVIQVRDQLRQKAQCLLRPTLGSDALELLLLSIHWRQVTKTSSHSEWGIRLYLLKRLSRNQWTREIIRGFLCLFVCFGLVLVWVYMGHSISKGHNKEMFYLVVLISWSFRFCLTLAPLFNGGRGMRLGLFDFIVLEGGGQIGFLLVPGS